MVMSPLVPGTQTLLAHTVPAPMSFFSWQIGIGPRVQTLRDGYLWSLSCVTNLLSRES